MYVRKAIVELLIDVKLSAIKFIMCTYACVHAQTHTG